MAICISTKHITWLKLVNRLRAKHGERPLHFDAILHQTAHEHAADMAGRDYFAHEGRDGRSVRQRAEDNGYPSGWVGENISYGYPTPRLAYEIWRDSPPHLNNLISSNYTAVGLALNVEPDWDFQGDVFSVNVAVFGWLIDDPAPRCRDQTPEPDTREERRRRRRDARQEQRQERREERCRQWKVTS